MPLTPFTLHTNRITELSGRFSEKLHRLESLNAEIEKELHDLTGKKAKGDQLVSILGEAIFAALTRGTVIPEEAGETDVLVGEIKVSVKTRRGTGKGWTQTSLISSNNPEALDYLAFVHLHSSYLTDKIWLFPWKHLIQSNRIKHQKVRGIHRGYVFHLCPTQDTAFQIYPEPHD
jgi:hypothetical protein